MGPLFLTSDTNDGSHYSSTDCNDGVTIPPPDTKTNGALFPFPNDRAYPPTDFTI
ncbi:unnamed protein product [Staurois parvus]|uniref:Uncharacterized protein n=1 Tax=Staurois parvus TaxID=386267 RepID=A0ABN9GKE9_9NEOB|nr:unnamed protein product [Staurois parvus]